jgi:hypothetical protein
MEQDREEAIDELYNDVMNLIDAYKPRLPPNVVTNMLIAVGVDVAIECAPSHEELHKHITACIATGFEVNQERKEKK